MKMDWTMNCNRQVFRMAYVVGDNEIRCSGTNDWRELVRRDVLIQQLQKQNENKKQF